MELQIKSDLIHIVILDIDRVYTQIYDEMWVSEIEYHQIRKAYGNYHKYRIIRL